MCHDTRHTRRRRRKGSKQSGGKLIGGGGGIPLVPFVSADDVSSLVFHRTPPLFPRLGSADRKLATVVFRTERRQPRDLRRLPAVQILPRQSSNAFFLFFFFFLFLCSLPFLFFSPCLFGSLNFLSHDVCRYSERKEGKERERECVSVSHFHLIGTSKYRGGDSYRWLINISLGYRAILFSF